MENECEDLRVPLGRLTGITLNVAAQEEIEKISVVSIESASEVTDSRLGLPNPSSTCSTCGAKDIKRCEGHFGHINLVFTTLHPYFLSEVAQILNKICPACKSIRRDSRVKVSDSANGHCQPSDCLYCLGGYPRMKFKVSTNDIFKKSAIIVEVNESTRLQRRSLRGGLPEDYWHFIPRDPHIDESCMKPNKRVLSHAQVNYFLKDLDPNFIRNFVPKKDSVFLNCFPVTPNRHRVAEVIRGLSNEHRLTFDERTRAYRKLVSFRGTANELGSRILDSLKISKLYTEQSSSKDLILPQQKKTDCPTKSSGSRWIKDVVLGKRSDHCFRMVVVGDPNIKLTEIGIPSKVAERMLIAEVLNKLNLEKSGVCWNLRLIEEGEIFVRRNHGLVRVRPTDELHIGDTIYRPLRDGDIVLINRPPSIHQHSLIALSAKVLPTKSVTSLNPLCCSPFRGDFDGDCLHGYFPQSIDTRAELKDLVSLDKQLFNGQSGKNLISLSQDSLTAAHLILEDTISVNKYQMQQLQMFCPPRELFPSIIKAPSINTPLWTGKQAFSMILPQGFNYVFAPNDVCIEKGELISASEESSWLRDIEGNLFYNLAKYSSGKVLDILFAAQELLCEWLSMRGLSVSLLDLNVTSDSYSRKNMMDEVRFGLQEAEETCVYRHLLNSCPELFTDSNEESPSSISVLAEHFCYEKQKSAALTQASVDVFRTVFRDIQSLAYKYAEKDNSLLAMFKSGSKGNMLKLVQHSMCLGVQHSLVALSFRMPRMLSCAAWNDHKARSLNQKDGALPDSSKSYIPYAVVESSFLIGLNPLESFVHSVTNRDSSFSDNAQLPGTLTRRLMFFMRDLYTAYDGTVRNAYGNQLIQFSYTDSEGASSDNLYEDSTAASQAIGGQPVGVMAACALSEAAYSALDQPVSLLETSPLLNLKKALECGSGKNKVGQIITMSLYLSGKLGRQRHGCEYAALEIRNYLEGLLLSEIVSSIMIIFVPHTGGKRRFSPWVCHIHICKEILRSRRLKVQSVIDSLNQRCKTSRIDSKVHMPKMQIVSNDCSLSDTHKEDGDIYCIAVSVAEDSMDSSRQLDMVRDLVIPFLLETVVKGFQGIKLVDILWRDRPKVSKCTRDSSGELYLRVSMSGQRGKTRCWDVLKNNCLPIMGLIDWSRSHPDNMNEFCLAYGIDAGLKYFLNNLESSVSDVGKTIRPQHLLLVANSLSVTGGFVGLTSKGLAQQREHASVPSPFSQACFANPAPCFIKAAKTEVTDGLCGSIDALAWGNVPPFGTGGQFELLYSGKGVEIDKPTNVFNLLNKGISSDKNNKIKKPDAENHTAVSFGAQLLYKYESSVSKWRKKLGIPKAMIKKLFKVRDIRNLASTLNNILHEYPINRSLNDFDNSTLMMALYFHPQRDAKIGTGAKYIKVGYHPKYHKSRCFVLVRTDGTAEDFSYRKCILGALEIIDPQEAERYKSKMSHNGPDQVGVETLSRPT